MYIYMPIAIQFPAVSASREADKTARRRREDRQTPYVFIGAVTVVVAVARRGQLGHFHWRVLMFCRAYGKTELVPSGDGSFWNALCPGFFSRRF